MGAGAIAFVTLIVMGVAAACGVVTASILAKCNVAKITGFGWGATLGPIGILVAVVAQDRFRRRAARTSILPWE